MALNTQTLTFCAQIKAYKAAAVGGNRSMSKPLDSTRSNTTFDFGGGGGGGGGGGERQSKEPGSVIGTSG